MCLPIRAIWLIHSATTDVIVEIDVINSPPHFNSFTIFHPTPHNLPLGRERSNTLAERATVIAGL